MFGKACMLCMRRLNSNGTVAMGYSTTQPDVLQTQCNPKLSCTPKNSKSSLLLFTQTNGQIIIFLEWMNPNDVHEAEWALRFMTLICKFQAKHESLA